MRRFSPEVFHDLRTWSVGTGTGVGLVFPFGLMILGIPARDALHWSTLLVSVLAGSGVGWLLYRFTQQLIRPELQKVVHHLQSVQEQLGEEVFTGEQVDERDWHLPVLAQDEMGEMAVAFNGLVDELLRLQRLEAIGDAWSATISNHLELEPLAATVMDEMLRHLGAVAGAFLVVRGEELVVVDNHGLTDPQRLTSSAQVQRALRTGMMGIVRVPEGVTIEGAVTDFRPVQVMILPIVHADQRLGVVVLATDTLFSKDAMWLLRIFQRGLNLALNNALAHDRMQRLAAVDPLTGAFNRRFGMRRLHEECAKAARLQQPVTTLMFDIDHFKRVNDTYGHLVGDRVLVQVVGRAREVLRESDILIRYGGEEFVAVLPAVDREAGRRVAERLREAVAGQEVEYDDGTFQVTISVGVATFHPDGSQIDEDAVLKRADDALYAAKESGRNRVVCHGDPVMKQQDPVEQVVEAVVAGAVAGEGAPAGHAPVVPLEVDLPKACILP